MIMDEVVQQAQRITLPNWLITPETKAVFAALTQKGKDAPRFVGGCVRDAILGKNGADIDIATPLTPEEVVERLSAHKIRTIPTGIKHGTVTAVIHQQPFEITTLRKDITCDGRHAEVAYTDSWEEDAARRDFTINAMSCTLEGALYDYFNGREDLSKGVVRFIGDANARVKEDYLRILRFFRFHACYSNNDMETIALQACKEHAEQVDNLSGERIQAEMLKLLKSPDPSSVLRMMQFTGVLPFTMIEVRDFTPFKQLLQLEEKLSIGVDAFIRLAALLRQSVLPARGSALALSARWRLANKEGVELLELVSPREPVTANMSQAEQKVAIRKWGADMFCKQVYLSWSGQENMLAAEEQFAAMLTLAKEWKAPEFPLSGKDVLELGIAPGRMVGELLRKAEKKWEEQDYQPNREEIVRWIRAEEGKS